MKSILLLLFPTFLNMSSRPFFLALLATFTFTLSISSVFQPPPLPRHSSSANSTRNTVTRSTAAALTFDHCRAFSDCSQAGYSLYCSNVNRGANGVHCMANYPTCRCMPSRLRACASDGDCVPGEVCATYTPGNAGLLARWEQFPFPKYDLDAPFCVSEQAELSLNDVERYPSPADPSSPTGDDTVIDATTSLTVNGGGLVLERCTDGRDCADTHLITACMTFEPDNVFEFCTSSAQTCRCMVITWHEFTVCEDDDDCLVGEGCATYTGERGGLLTQIFTLDYTRPFCASLIAINELDDVKLLSPTSTTETPPPSGGSAPTTETDPPSSSATSEDEGEVCIDARALSHLDASDLVLPKHALAPVLCDANDSCATRGHMVTFRARPMRMSTYCQMKGVRCSEVRRLVNSPRYRRGRRVASRTDGLVFTALAARYATRAEEMVLAAAVRMGM